MKRLIVLLTPLLMLTGCAKYKSCPLPFLKKTELSVHAGNEPVSFEYRLWSRGECKKYLGRNIIRAGYQPIHVTITNNSDRMFSFSRHHIDIATIEPEVVARAVHTNTVGRATAYGVGSIFIFPLVIPAIVDGIGSAKANERLDRDYDKKTLCDQTLEPYGTINGVIFVPAESARKQFKITLTEPKTSTRISLNSHSASVITA